MLNALYIYIYNLICDKIKKLDKKYNPESLTEIDSDHLTFYIFTFALQVLLNIIRLDGILCVYRYCVLYSINLIDNSVWVIFYFHVEYFVVLLINSVAKIQNGTPRLTNRHNESFRGAIKIGFQSEFFVISYSVNLIVFHNDIMFH